jgi:predicted MPP superfamily phosphohydrolase
MFLATNSGPFELIKLRVSTSELSGLSVLHVSDIHFAPGQRKKADFIKGLAELEPDLVVNTGDNLGHRDAISPALSALDPLLEYPGVFVNGSNDYRAPKPKNPVSYLLSPSKIESPRNLDTKRFVTELEGSGWLNLNNQSGKLKVAGSSLGFLGLDDPHENLDDISSLENQRSGLGQVDYLFGVAHAPYMRVIEAFSNLNVGMMFAGHTHGGQICLPGKRALVTNSDLDARYASGLSAWGERDGMVLHVSQGMGQSIYAPLRLNCPPAATLIEFV